MSESRANDRQVGGGHYMTGAAPDGRQHWDVVAEFGLDYFQGQVTRYLFRWREKGGVEDLRKAAHFLEKYIELAEAGSIDGAEKNACATRGHLWDPDGSLDPTREEYVEAGETRRRCYRCGRVERVVRRPGGVRLFEPVSAPIVVNILNSGQETS